MRLVKVPDAVVLLDRYGDRVKKPNGDPLEPKTMFEFLLEFGNEPKLSKDLAAVRRYSAMLDKFADAKPGDTIDVDETLWKSVSAALDEPTGGWQPADLTRKLMSLIDAFQAATKSG